VGHYGKFQITDHSAPAGRVLNGSREKVGAWRPAARARAPAARRRTRVLCPLVKIDWTLILGAEINSCRCSRFVPNLFSRSKTGPQTCCNISGLFGFAFLPSRCSADYESGALFLSYALRLIGIGITISPLIFAALSSPTPGSALKVCAMWPLARCP
jgi:hypothetical protein